MTTDAEAAAPRARLGWLPVVRWLPGYRLARLPGDVLAGAVVVALAVPQALGYAGIAGVPVQMGLYAIPLALLAYAVLGSSPHLVVGPVSTVSVLSGSIVAGLAGGSIAHAMALTSALAISAGLVMLLGGLLRIGWAVEFLSRPIITGFVFGLVVLIVVGEVPSLLGMPAESGDVVARVLSLFAHLSDITPVTAVVGVTSLAILFLGARFLPRVPWSLLVLVGSILLSHRLDLAARGVATVGPVPQGLPPIGLPGIDLADLSPVIVGGIALGLVALAEGMSAARLFGIRLGYRVDADQELLATGASNVAAGVSGGLGVGGSLSKTASAVRAGSSSQVTGVVAAVLVLVVLVLFTSSLTDLPRAVLSAIVIQAVWGLMDVPALRRYLAVRRNDFLGAIAAMIGVLILGPLYGLLFAIAQSLLGLVYRSSRVHIDVMGKVPGEKAAWGSVSRHPERRTVDGVLVLRLDVPLFWANATEVVSQVLDAVDDQPGTYALLLDLEATSQLDTTSVDALDVLLDRLGARGVELYLVRVFHSARTVLRRSGYLDRLGSERMWHSISAGVRAAKEAHAAEVVAEGRGGTEPPYDEYEPGDERIAAGHPDDEPDEPGDGTVVEEKPRKAKKKH